MSGLIIIVVNGVVNNISKFNHAEDLIRGFIQTCADYGVEPSDKDIRDGYVRLDGGITINMVEDV